MNWENPPPEFQYILFERIEPEQQRWGQRALAAGGLANHKFCDLPVGLVMVSQTN